MRANLSPADCCDAVLRRKPFTAKGWLWALEYDGFRVFVRRADDACEMLSRNSRSVAHAFPEVVATIATLPDGVYDGELVVLDSAGRADAGELRRRSLMRMPRTIDEAALQSPAALVLVDVLKAGGRDIRWRPLAARKKWLDDHIIPRHGLRLAEVVETEGEALFLAMIEHGYRSMVGKRLDAPYRAGRQASWVRIKNPLVVRMPSNYER